MKNTLLSFDNDEWFLTLAINLNLLPEVKESPGQKSGEVCSNLCGRTFL